MGIKLDSKKRTLALGVLIIGAGATLPDIDHILPPHTRSWGHNSLLVLAVFLLVVGIAYLGRLAWIRFLR